VGNLITFDRDENYLIDFLPMYSRGADIVTKFTVRHYACHKYIIIITLVEMEPKSMKNIALLLALFGVIGTVLALPAAPVPMAHGQEANNDDNGGGDGTDNGIDLSVVPLDEDGVAACGEVITEDVALNTDLVCDDTGLIVGADGVAIDLAGFSIISNGEEEEFLDLSVDFEEDVGVLVPNHADVTIVGHGQIRGFDRGVSFQGSGGGEVSDVFLRENEVGILASGSDDVAIEHNTIDNNDFAVVSTSSEGGEITFNLIAENTEQGIVLLNSDDYSIAANNVFDNGNNGIFLDAQSFTNVVDFNTAFGHDEADLNNSNGVPPNINDNTFGASNNCETSRPGGLCD
jgi:hypothetical protein